ncbi:glutenin, high molecular weight subunit PW212-like [Scyliorhinus canicula]|uniref:glutenin, high molecular weight subunit PW212-like n=1 Tax=Scyliorhinus canicula TaxID=7830 RepID=UPI0018F4A878|nr:glutenin, high molecular weight subunit PW212-like [Scyliorhinus canicula]
MGGGWSKWRKISVGEPEAGECRGHSATEDRGDRQAAGQGGQSGGGQQTAGGTERREGGRWQHDPGSRRESRLQTPAEDGSIEQELERALEECPDWRGEPGPLQPPNVHTTPCSQPAFNSTPHIQMVGKQSEPLLGSQQIPAQPGHSQQGEREGATQTQTPALSPPKPHTNHRKQQQNLPHDLFTISTQDIENNNLANGWHINRKNASLNSTPILYDYSEEELMACIIKEYS